VIIINGGPGYDVCHVGNNEKKVFECEIVYRYANQ